MANASVPGHKGFVVRSVAERFASFVRPGEPDECWVWTGYLHTGGYASIDVGEGRRRPAHVVSWELAHGVPFPVGMDGCHTCDNPPCVNPSHVWPGTPRENGLDASAKGRIFRPTRRLACPHGHPLDGVLKGGAEAGRRFCRTCNNARRARNHAKLRAS